MGNQALKALSQRRSFLNFGPKLAGAAGMRGPDGVHLGGVDPASLAPPDILGTAIAHRLLKNGRDRARGARDGSFHGVADRPRFGELSQKLRGLIDRRHATALGILFRALGMFSRHVGRLLWFNSVEPKGASRCRRWTGIRRTTRARPTMLAGERSRETRNRGAPARSAMRETLMARAHAPPNAARRNCGPKKPPSPHRERGPVREETPTMGSAPAGNANAGRGLGARAGRPARTELLS
ncbi:hypothetical protein Mnod_4244 [Methylobacterium nodulans ORS 2060]|uniref:Uncharacterized protein n=1 Tax=Methylobacterium nodulans (strain LMG 21967 / CNCM I-2342 / ORS 2060) TaxID=460265 RepID=B8IA57_METNO|nr:hypothetical protein Mnod_4244 [Methylobacterium nodulans ORS 2060]